MYRISNVWAVTLYVGRVPMLLIVHRVRVGSCITGFVMQVVQLLLYCSISITEYVQDVNHNVQPASIHLYNAQHVQIPIIYIMLSHINVHSNA